MHEGRALWSFERPVPLAALCGVNAALRTRGEPFRGSLFLPSLSCVAVGIEQSDGE